MKNIIINNERTKLNIRDINLLENNFDIKLPEDYKNFLLTHNGGYPEKDCYSFIDVENASNLKRFLAFYDIKVDFHVQIYDDLVKEYLKLKDRIPQECIPIARDSGGNYVCLGIKGSEYGKVYFWDHEEEADEGEHPTFANMYLLANNFTDFINGLYSVDIEEQENKEGVFSSSKYIDKHDNYSLPFSAQVKKYGSIVTNFFNKAPIEVKDYLIERTRDAEELALKYEVKSENKRYIRKINKDGKVIEEKIEEMN